MISSVLSSDRIKLATYSLTKTAEDPNWLQRMLLSLGVIEPPPKPKLSPAPDLAGGAGVGALVGGAGVGGAHWNLRKLQKELDQNLDVMAALRNQGEGVGVPLAGGPGGRVPINPGEGSRVEDRLSRGLGNAVEEIGNTIRRSTGGDRYQTLMAASADLMDRAIPRARALRLNTARVGVPGLIGLGLLGGWANYKRKQG